MDKQTVDKEAILNSEAKRGMIEFNLDSFKRDYLHLYKTILAAMDSYSASLVKERDELKEKGVYDLEKLFEWIMDENRKKAQTHFTASVARNIASMVELKLYELKSSNEAKEKERDYWKQLAEAAGAYIVCIEKTLPYHMEKNKYHRLKSLTPNKH